VELSSKAGFGWLSTSPVDFDQTVASGLSAKEQRQIAADNGVKLSYLDPLTSWVPDWRPVNEDPDILPYLKRSPESFLRVAEDLQVDKIHLIGTFPKGRYSIEELTQHFGSMADRAAKEGLRVTLEAMPLWGFATFEEAWQVVKGAGRSNAGIIFDTWHYVRGGRKDELLSEIPSSAIDTVQIADGSLVCPPGRSMARDCLFHRVPVGEGEIPNSEILALLAKNNLIPSVGPEIFSSALDSLPPEEIFARIMPGFEKVIDAI
jgi:4-hydroxyphenylpyruvate dioxygenase